jgi:hypothetical protein
MDQEQKKTLAKEFGIALAAWALFVTAMLFSSAAAEFTYAMF